MAESSRLYEDVEVDELDDEDELLAQEESLRDFGEAAGFQEIGTDNDGNPIWHEHD